MHPGRSIDRSDECCAKPLAACLTMEASTSTGKHMDNISLTTTPPFSDHEIIYYQKHAPGRRDLQYRFFHDISGRLKSSQLCEIQASPRNFFKSSVGALPGTI